MTDGPSRGSRKSWRERLGLQEPEPDPGDWVPVTSAGINNGATGFSRTAARAAQVLTDTGIETEQRPYVLADAGGYLRLPGAIPSSADRIRVAVLVRRRDLDRAKEVLRPYVSLPDDPEPEPIRDDELARMSKEAGELARE
jgi:hypothetical protein